MTAPRPAAPRPSMNSGPEHDREALSMSKGSRRMLAFYVGTGVVLALFVGGWLGRTPLRIRYYKWRLASVKDDYEKLQAGYGLARLGRPAQAAFRELIRSEDWKTREYAVAAMHNDESVLWIPVLVEASRDPKQFIAARAVCAVYELSDRAFDAPSHRTRPPHLLLAERPDRRDDRKAMLEWWEREGNAKYGDGGK